MFKNALFLLDEIVSKRGHGVPNYVEYFMYFTVCISKIIGRGIYRYHLP